ncbi:MAG: methionine synthase, partial [Actinomycetota bacterium]|nr:methionine synthase [Actinomycetota bacterium]
AVPSVEPGQRPTDQAPTDQVLRLLDMLGFDPSTAGANLVVTPSCGLAGASASWSRQALALSRNIAENLC